MVNFLILNEKVPKYSKEDIDKGKTPLDAYILCSCLRETFCLSYKIRKSNNLYMYFQEGNLLIKFEGIKLRYLGPDERSQALLLGKALIKAKREGDSGDIIWKKSTPGIFIRSFHNDHSFFTFFYSLFRGKRILIVDCCQDDEKNGVDFKENDFKANGRNESLFIIPNYPRLNEASEVIQLFEGVENKKNLFLSKINSLENKILYINYQKDQQEPH